MNKRSLGLALQQCNSLAKLKQIHGYSITVGQINHHQPLACKLLNAYSKLGQPLSALNVFTHHIQHQNPDQVSWTCLVSLYLQLQRPHEAFSVFSQSLLSGIKPDGHSFVGAVTACGRMNDLKCGNIVHAMVFRYGFVDSGGDPIVGNALIDMYGRNKRIKLAERVFWGMQIKDTASWTSLVNGYVKINDLQSARQLFDKMPQRNAISWTTMITGYVRGERPVLALELFQAMIRAELGVNEYPTAFTIVAVLSGCADVGALELGQLVHGYAIKTKLVTETAVSNALVDLYSKSGRLDFAMDSFHETNQKDVFSWTSMIFAFALHGKGQNAIECFNKMAALGFVPNEVTYLSVLLACSHSGLVAEGKRLFDKLHEPKIEHYGCLVDLLGRAGLLDQTVKFIERMPIDPDAAIWRSLLSACLGRGEMKLAEMAAKNVLALEPDDDGAYALLWKIYCSENRWDDAMKTRKKMRVEKIKKRPGCSWMEVNGGVREFLADDTMQRDSNEIYGVLETIHGHFEILFGS